MANIGKQLTGAQLLDSPDEQGTYGDRLIWLKENDECSRLETKSKQLLARATKDGATVDLDVVASVVEAEPVLVPYVNAFIAHSNQRVEKYWRTREYRVTRLDRTKPELRLSGEIAPAGSLGLTVVPGPLAGLANIKPEVVREFGKMLVDWADAVEKEQRRAERAPKP